MPQGGLVTIQMNELLHPIVNSFGLVVDHLHVIVCAPAVWSIWYQSLSSQIGCLLSLFQLRDISGLEVVVVFIKYLALLPWTTSKLLAKYFC